MLKFIKVTRKRNGSVIRLNADHIVSYGDAIEGTWVDTTTENGEEALIINEAPEYLDRIFGLIE